MSDPRWLVASETGRLTDVLVCPPDHYRWMPINAIARHSLLAGNGNQPSRLALAAQHRELCDALAQAGVTVHAMPPEPHLPAMPYTRDPVVVTHRGPVLCQLERPQRRGEYAPALAWHAAQGSPFWRMASAGTVEGGDVHILRPGLAAIGCSGSRTDAEGAGQLADWLRAEGWQVRVEPFDEHFLHLDVLFCMAAPGLAVACTAALDAAFINWLAAAGIRCIDVAYPDTMALGCNVVALGGGRVLSCLGSRTVNDALRAEGLEVFDPDLSLFTAGGGGPHCLTCPLSRAAD
jgi:N-dimethylarginine dimethylaminohydrolase